MKHYIGLAGLRGYIPGICKVFDTIRSAADSLAQAHELNKPQRDRLMRNQYLELPRGCGHEYAEISQRDCSTPWLHSDGVSQQEWEREHHG
jgi:hypothetical protein